MRTWKMELSTAYSFAKVALVGAILVFFYNAVALIPAWSSGIGFTATSIYCHDHPNPDEVAEALAADVNRRLGALVSGEHEVRVVDAEASGHCLGAQTEIHLESSFWAAQSLRSEAFGVLGIYAAENGLDYRSFGYSMELPDITSRDQASWSAALLLPVFLIFYFLTRGVFGAKPLSSQGQISWTGVAGWVLAVFVMVSLGGTLASVVGLNVHQADFSGERPTVSAIIFAVLIAPVVEEVIFRHWLLRRYAEVLGNFAAIILSTLAFVAIHFQASWFALVSVAAVGAMLCLVYVRTGSLAKVVFAHALWNGLVLMGLALQGWV